MAEDTQEHKTREQERSAHLQTKASGISDDNSLQRSVPPLPGQTEIDERLRIEAEFVSLEAIRRIAKKIAEDTAAGSSGPPPKSVFAKRYVRAVYPSIYLTCARNCANCGQSSEA